MLKRAQERDRKLKTEKESQENEEQERRTCLKMGLAFRTHRVCCHKIVLSEKVN